MTPRFLFSLSKSYFLNECTVKPLEFTFTLHNSQRMLWQGGVKLGKEEAFWDCSAVVTISWPFLVPALLSCLMFLTHQLRNSVMDSSHNQEREFFRFIEPQGIFHLTLFSMSFCCLLGREPLIVNSHNNPYKEVGAPWKTLRGSDIFSLELRLFPNSLTFGQGGRSSTELLRWVSHSPTVPVCCRCWAELRDQSHASSEEK